MAMSRHIGLAILMDITILGAGIHLGTILPTTLGMIPGTGILGTGITDGTADGTAAMDGIRHTLGAGATTIPGTIPVIIMVGVGDMLTTTGIGEELTGTIGSFLMERWQAKAAIEAVAVVAIQTETAEH